MRLLLIFSFLFLASGCEEVEFFSNINKAVYCSISVYSTDVEIQEYYKENCSDPVNYPSQIDNSDSDRFDVASYAIPVNGSDNLEGKWLIFDLDASTNQSIREVCDVKLTDNVYTMECELLGVETFTYDSNNSEVFLEQTIRESNRDDPYVSTRRLEGVVLEMNRIDIVLNTTTEYEDGEIYYTTKDQYEMIRIGGIDHELGSIKIFKDAPDSKLIDEPEDANDLTESYQIDRFVEIETNDKKGYIKLIDTTSTEVSQSVYLPNDVIMPEAGVYHPHEYEGPFVKKEWFAEINPELFESLDSSALGNYIFRKFDYEKNDSEGVDINFVISWKYSESTLIYGDVVIRL